MISRRDLGRKVRDSDHGAFHAEVYTGTPSLDCSQSLGSMRGQCETAPDRSGLRYARIQVTGRVVYRAISLLRTVMRLVLSMFLKEN